MGFRTVKQVPTDEDFEQRKEKAIKMLAGQTLIGSNKQKYKFSEKELREDFDIDDADCYGGRSSQVFFNGDFVIMCKEKILMV